MGLAWSGLSWREWWWWWWGWERTKTPDLPSLSKAGALQRVIQRHCLHAKACFSLNFLKIGWNVPSLYVFVLYLVVPLHHSGPGSQLKGHLLSEAHLDHARHCLPTLSHYPLLFFSLHMLLSDSIGFICSLVWYLSSPLACELQQTKVWTVCCVNITLHIVCAQIFPLCKQMSE